MFYFVKEYLMLQVAKKWRLVGWFLGSGTKIIPWYASRTQSLSERLPICVNCSEIVTGPATFATRISASSLPRVEHESLVYLLSNHVKPNFHKPSNLSQALKVCCPHSLHPCAIRIT
jgi:hypothetical protein